MSYYRQTHNIVTSHDLHTTSTHTNIIIIYNNKRSLKFSIIFYTLYSHSVTYIAVLVYCMCYDILKRMSHIVCFLSLVHAQHRQNAFTQSE
jgi:hypothetical protein